MAHHPPKSPIPPLGIEPLYDFEVADTLVEELVEVADDIRALYTEFGLRPYRIFAVWVGWLADEDDDGAVTGDEVMLLPPERWNDPTAILSRLVEVGVGRPKVLFEKEILPTPLAEPVGISRRLDITGDTEQGSLLMTQISSRLSEDELMGLVVPFRDPNFTNSLRPGIDFFYEMRENRPKGFISPGFEGFEPSQELRPIRRRFRVSQSPVRDADAFEWRVVSTGRMASVTAMVTWTDWTATRSSAPGHPTDWRPTGR